MLKAVITDENYDFNNYSINHIDVIDNVYKSIGMNSIYCGDKYNKKYIYDKLDEYCGKNNIITKLAKKDILRRISEITSNYYDIYLSFGADIIQSVTSNNKRYKSSKNLFCLYDNVLSKVVRDHPCITHSSDCRDNVECIKKLKQDKYKENEDNEAAIKELYKEKNVDYSWLPNNLKADIIKKYNSNNIYSKDNIINSSGCMICKCNYM